MSEATRGDGPAETPLHPGTGHETTDISLRPLVKFLIGLVVSLALVALVLRWQFSYFVEVQSPGQAPLAELPPLTDGPTAEPRLQEAPEVDMAELRAREQRELESLGWVDRKAGTAKIPIEEAMKVLVQRGLPARKGQ